MTKYLLVLILAIFSTYAQCGTIDPNTPDNKYLEYGSGFESVIKICCSSGKISGCGSAVVIDPHWIITAAHIVENCESCFVTVGDKKIKITKIIISPEYSEQKFGHGDIALGFCEEEIVIDYYPGLYSKDDEVGKLCSIAGWGTTGTFSSGANKFDDKRRGGSNFVDETFAEVLVCSPSMRDSNYTSLEILISPGDSGGGLFIGNELAAIHSSVMASDKNPNSSYTDQSTHTRISVYRDWIISNIEQR